MVEKVKAILDFDGTLTDEPRQAAELAVIAKQTLAEEILGCPSELVEARYDRVKAEILARPELYCWTVNGLPACYAYEGAYLLNTVILQQLILSEPDFLTQVQARFPAEGLDPVTRCVNHLFHEGSLKVNPCFLSGAREFLLSLLAHEGIETVILTNSQTRKVSQNLQLLEIGEKGVEHPFNDEIGILGDTRQYHLDGNWWLATGREREADLVLPIDAIFSVDLRRPVYYEALRKEMEKGYKEIVVAADGFSLAGALPLVMGLRFILFKTAYTPLWVEEYVARHPRGGVAASLEELGEAILALL